MGGAGTWGVGEGCTPGGVACVEEGDMGRPLDQDNRAAWEDTQEGSCVVLGRKDSPWEEKCHLERREGEVTRAPKRRKTNWGLL